MYDWFDAYNLFRGNVAYVWHSSTYCGEVKIGLEKAGFTIKQQIIWNKNVHTLGMCDYQWKHEPCWYAVRDAKKRNWKGGRPQKTVWDIKSIIFEEDKTSHPTQKPVEIYLRPINIHTNPGEYIYEPFGGSGTAVIAAQMTDRRCLCMEMDPKFVDVIINIWEKMTEESAIRESDGKSYSLLKEAALALNK